MRTRRHHGSWFALFALGAALTLPVPSSAQEERTPLPPDQAPEAGTTANGQPSGYLGITFSCKLRSWWGPEGRTITHYGYPVVAAVAAGSPAERAGISVGDTIVAYDARDVRYHPIVLNKLLQANALLRIRLKHNGQERDVSVRVARRPPEFVDVAPAAPLRETPPSPLSPPSATPAPGPAPVAVVTAPGPDAAAPEARRPPPWWTKPLIGPDVVGAATGEDDDRWTIAGAQVVRTTPDLRAALGVTKGILVVAVEAGSPASESSLRAGDVIVSAGGANVTTTRQLLRAIEHALENNKEISLEVERQHKTRRVTLGQ